MKYLFISSIIFLFISCKNNVEEKEAANYLEKFGKELSEDQVQEFIDLVADQFIDKELNSLKSKIQFKAFSYRGVLSSSEVIETKMFDEIAKQVSDNFPMFNDFQTNFDYFDHVKSYTDDDGYNVVVFRAYSINNGFSYLEFILAEFNGDLTIIDMYSPYLGDYLSRIFMQTFSDLYKQKDIIEKGEFKDISEVKELMNAGEYQKAYDMYIEIPISIRQSTKSFEIFELIITSNLDEDLYMESMENYRAKYSGDASADILSLDYFLLKEDYASVKNAIFNLIDIYPNDGCLYSLLGNINLTQGNCESSYENYEKAVELSENIMELQDNLMTTYFDCGNYEKGFEMATHLIDIDYLTLEDIQYYLGVNFENHSSWSEYITWMADN